MPKTKRPGLSGERRYAGVIHKCRTCGENHKTRAHGKKK